MRFPQPPPSLPALEEDVLATWREQDTFQRSQEAAGEAGDFVFFEGPPTANGRPGLHHVVSRAIKDLVCRYQTMLGKRVTRIAGWDTHGLPVEIEAQQRLGLAGKREIEARGVAWFNEQCRSSVFVYKKEWEKFSERIGYWLDYSRPYATLDPTYVESVWWLLKRMADDGLLYRGHKVVPWCPADETVLSSHELSLGYRDVEDPSLYVCLDLLDGSGRGLLVWTTTPWTLVANVALAINPGLEYVEAEHEGRTLILARDRAETLLGSDAVRGRVAPEDILGKRYRRPFELVPEARAEGRAWEIVPGEFVTASEGTGIVHLAPAYGADDYEAGKELGLAVLEPLWTDGTFDPDCPLVGGMFFKEADDVLVDDLAARDLVFRYERAVHSYPHCWRCESPLVYMARHSWFARTSELRAEMVENNRRVAWHPPEVGRGRFEGWLKGAVDWALSRDRYWGTPLPVWVSEDDPERVEWIGSFEELAAKTGGLPADFDPHRPFIDELSWTCPETGSTMRRTPEVLDVWFDSGAMPWAQWHYPFENRKAFERHFPADFICEAVDQTRGWFYSLHAISALLGAGPAFRNVIVNDLILDAQGRKMSKSRGNTVDPWDAVADLGADGLRWYLITVSNPWLPTRYDPDAAKESASRFFDTLFNTYRFFALYGEIEAWEPSAPAPPPAARPVLDRWLLSRLHGVTARARADLDGFDPTPAYRELAAFVDGDMSNWYVRRARPRFWGATTTEDAASAFATLHEALRVVALLLAPVAPFASDWLHRALAGRSSHTERFPAPGRRARRRSPRSSDGARADAQHVGPGCARRNRRAGQAAVAANARRRPRAAAGWRRAAVAQGRNQREGDRVRGLRRPSGDAFGAAPISRSGPAFRQTDARGGRAHPRAGSRRAGGLSRRRRGARGGGRRTGSAGQGRLRDRVAGARRLGRAFGRRCVAALDPVLTDALVREGLARDLVNRIQRVRKAEGLAVTDRIRLGIGGGPAVVAAAREHGDHIARETLAVSLEACEALSGDFERRHELVIAGENAELALAAVS